jgi:Flp pilus assembly protein TadD
VFLKRGQLYEAASEFEWARKLLPGHPDPRVNLAMTLEQAGRSDEALATYATALEVYQNYLPAMQGLARLQIREGKPDDKTDTYLREIAMRGDTARWRDWARTQMIKRNGVGKE